MIINIKKFNYKHRNCYQIGVNTFFRPSTFFDIIPIRTITINYFIVRYVLKSFYLIFYYVN